MREKPRWRERRKRVGSPAKLGLFQVDRRGFSAVAAFELEAQLLTFVQIADPRALDCQTWTNTSCEPSSGGMKP
jgi:hypothetical protein